MSARWPGAMALATALLVADRPAQATCNLIPGVANSFRATLGTADRPFARPGDWVELRLAGPCGGRSPGFAETRDAHVVTLVFTPPGTAARHVVVLAPSCASLAAERDRCAARPDVALLTCLDANATAPGLALVTGAEGDRRE